MLFPPALNKDISFPIIFYLLARYLQINNSGNREMPSQTSSFYATSNENGFKK